MFRVFTFQDWQGQWFYVYDENLDHLALFGLNPEVLQGHNCIHLRSKSELPIPGDLPFEVYLSNLEETRRRQDNGFLAQQYFKRDATAQKFIVEEIPQDIDSFNNYKVIDSRPIKRADFNIKNCKNIEVEVKCLTFYLIHDFLYFYINSYEIEKLENLNVLTGKKTILAIYNQAYIDQENCSVIMIKLSTIKKNKTSVIYDKDKDCYKVPLSLAKEGFELLEKYRIKQDLYRK
ncbi:hypothetical protein [Chryseobacterium sp. KMC2]|uniref:hypothetical protein n=1 Tax=Chryseobacterium sp. KMC2 TaxID=2800705 RepID=UPI001922E26C|nr:hypothetical protein [Chryseobacterium sp. KMC2]MBL3545956.1 hypothetical protein [Chryseobacterium sp. KMC2]